jgi:hypothetical protein
VHTFREKKHNYANKNRENEMDEMNRGHERDEICVYKFGHENLKERHLLGDLYTDARVLCHWVKKTRYDVIGYINPLKPKLV